MKLSYCLIIDQYCSIKEKKAIEIIFAEERDGVSPKYLKVKLIRVRRSEDKSKKNYKQFLKVKSKYKIIYLCALIQQQQ